MFFEIKKVKLAIVSVFAIIFAVAGLTGDRFVVPSNASESGAPTGRTGAPGESTCTGCHNQNGGAGTIQVIAPASYVPGQTYQITVQHSTTNQTRFNWGFEVIPMAGSAMAGTVANTTSNTRIRVSGAKSYVTQTTAGTFPGQSGGAVWTFNWTAPATDVGNITFYAAGIQGDNDGSESGDITVTTNTVVTPQTAVVIHHGFSDFDGDGKADPSVFRPSTGIWYMNRSTSGFSAMQLGISTDIITPADFDGDDKADLAVWREAPANEAAFYILQSSNSVVRVETFGQTGDKPLTVADWDGDGKADPSVYRDSAVGSQSYFYYRGSLNNPSGNITYVPWGKTGDIPVRGDFDGDGKSDATIFRPAEQRWYMRLSSTGALSADSWGIASDKFVCADYDGDGKTDLAVFRSGIWYVKQSSNGLPAYYTWGLATDTLVPADYDGDGKADAAVYRSGVWYIRNSGTSALSVANFGLATDRPVPAAFVP